MHCLFVFRLFCKGALSDGVSMCWTSPSASHGAVLHLQCHISRSRRYLIGSIHTQLQPPWLDHCEMDEQKKEKQRQAKTAPFGVTFTRSLMIYWVASRTKSLMAQLACDHYCLALHGCCCCSCLVYTPSVYYQASRECNAERCSPFFSLIYTLFSKMPGTTLWWLMQRSP